MYVDGKMRTAEMIPGMTGECVNGNGGGVNSSMIYLIYCKDFYKFHNVLPPSTTIKKSKKRQLLLLVISSQRIKFRSNFLTVKATEKNITCIILY
jgi:hypothetical protein